MDEYGKWDEEKHKIMLKSLRKIIPRPVQLEPYSFTKKDKALLIDVNKE